MINTYATLHCHSEYSSAVLRFPDAIGHIKDNVIWCYENNLCGYAISDHQSVSGYVELEQAYNALPKDKPFKHIFANEFYLLSEEEDNLRFSETQRPYYWHFMIYVLDEIGLKQMYELSSKAWLRSYTYKGLLRRPSYYSDLEEVIGENKGHLVCSSACLGGYLPEQILQKNTQNIYNFIDKIHKIFGKGNFYLEIQPCEKNNEEQIKVNKRLWELHEELNIPIIVTTDAHYKRPEDKIVHKSFLLSKDGGDSRETEDFYSCTYLFTPDELRDNLHLVFTDKQIDELFQTTIDIADRVEKIVIKKTTRVPALPEIPEHEVKHYYKNYYNQFPNINYFANSKLKNETFYYSEIEKNLFEYSNNRDIVLEDYLKEIDWEFEQVKGLGEIFNGECMADYFTVVQKIVDLIWTEGDSFVGIGRGSAGAYVTNKLLNITGVDPLLSEIKEFYPPWRFCSVARSDSLFDIDIDIQSFKKEKIIKAIKDYFGNRRVCQVVTWGRLTAKTALEKAGKGLNIPDDTIGYIKSLIPVKRGATYSLSDCLYGNEKKDRKPVPEFIAELKKYPELLRTSLALEGTIISSGVHAGALNILKSDFTDTGSYMVSSNGAVISQFDLHQAEYAGDLKMDLLSIDALECLRSCMELLLKRGYIEWQGGLRETYNKYLGYFNLEQNNSNMWELLPKMPNAFQYDSKAGKEALRKIGATNLTELTLANGLMRLATPDGEQPIDKYIRYNSNIQEWYDDMTEYGLTEEEQNIFIDLLGNYSGLCISQESMMVCLMDERVCNFSLKQADRARKAVAKKSFEALQETENVLYEKGFECGRSKTFLDYLWKVQIEMSKSYAFNFCHSNLYSIECLQELNLYHKFPKIYWNTAVVITQAQSEDERENSSNSIDYGKIAKSIYKAKSINIIVDAPDINESDLSFGVNNDEDKILYGLSCISGINSAISQQIIQNRPYHSFKDFYNKNSYEGTLITPSKFKQLIKSGSFDCFDKDRIKIMKLYISYTTPEIESLSMQNMPSIKSSKVEIPQEIIAPYNFYKYVTDKSRLYCKHPKFKSKSIYKLDKHGLRYFNEHYADKMKVDFDFYEENGNTFVVDKSIEKMVKSSIEQIKEYINTKDFKKRYRACLMRQKYLEFIDNNEDVNKWSFDAVSFFSIEHQLAKVNRKEYNISLFDDLPLEPLFILKSYGKREWRQYEISQIAGVILSRNDSHHSVSLLDINNHVVECKFDAHTFAVLKAQISIEKNGKKIVKDKSWLNRGNAIILAGYRNGEDDFRVKSYKNNIFVSKCQIIDKVNEDGTIELRSKRWGDEE